MFKLLRYFLKSLVALFLVAVVSVVGVVTLVDPNQFKSIIQKRISEATGQMLSIQGGLSWHLTPSLSIEARDLALETSAMISENHFTVKKIRLAPKLWSILSGKPLVNIQVEGLNAHFSQTIAGNSLLDNIQNMPLFHTAKKSTAFWILPYDITIENATLHWQDAITHEDIHFKNIRLLAQKVSLGAVGIQAPLDLQFEIEDANTDHTGTFSLKAAWAFNHLRQQFDIQNLVCHTNFPRLPFNTLLANLHIQRSPSMPVIEGSVHVPDLDLQAGFSNFNLPFYSISAKAADLKGHFSYQKPMLSVTSFNLAFDNEASISGFFKTDIHAKTLKSLNLSGNFTAKNLRIGTLPIPEVKTMLQAKEGIFIFDQVKAQLASSHHQGRMQVDIRNDVPEFVISDELHSFEINEVLARLDLKDKLYGSIKANVNLTTQGSTPDAWLQHLSGKAYLHLTDGRLRGIDLSPLLRHAQSTLVMLKDTLSKRNTVNIGAILTAELGEWRLQAMNVDLLVTPFRHLETNITFDKGRAYTSDFKLIHPEYTVNAHGMVDLTQRHIESQALALLTHPKSHPSEAFSAFLKETPLAIQLKGPLDNVTIQPNLTHYADGAINLVHKTPAEKTNDSHSLEKLFGFP